MTGRARLRRVLPAAAAALLALVTLPEAAARRGPRPPEPLPAGSPTALAGCRVDDPRSQIGARFPGSQVEPHVVAHPRPRPTVVAAWQQDRWSNGGARAVLVATGAPGGAWRLGGETRTSACGGGPAPDRGGYPRVTDPWLAAGPDGVTYLATLSVGQDARSPFGVGPDAILVARSSDGGRSWAPPVTVIRDEDPATFHDKPSVTADPNRPGTAYVVWTRASVAADGHRGAALLSRTVDGGRTWDEPRQVFDPGRGAQTFGNQIVVLSDRGPSGGELLGVFVLVRRPSPEAPPTGEVAAVRSDDGGRTWSGPIRIAAASPVETVDPLTRRLVTSGTRLPDVAVDGRSGTVYVVWSEGRFSGGRHNDVALSISRNGGLSWTDPVRVNRTPAALPEGNRQAFVPTVEASPRAGVAVGYYDLRRNGRDRDPDAPLESDRFLVHCHRPSPADPDRCADVTGWLEARLTEAPFDLRSAPPSPGFFLGDYAGLAAVGSRFVSVFAVTTGADGTARAVSAWTDVCSHSEAGARHTPCRPSTLPDPGTRRGDASPDRPGGSPGGDPRGVLAGPALVALAAVLAVGAAAMAARRSRGRLPRSRAPRKD